MTPYQQFRLWARRAPIGERLSAAAGVAVALSVVALLLVPAARHPAKGQNAAYGVGTNQASSGAAGTGGEAPAGIATAGANGAIGAGGNSAPGGVARAGVTSAGASATGSGTAVDKGGCVSPPGSDQGVNASQIKVAILLANIVGPAGNEAFGVPPASVQQQDYQMVVDSINASGGVACRKVIPEFFTVNPADQSDLQQKCLDISQAGVFFAIDIGNYSAYPALMDCYAQHQISFYNEAPSPNAQMQHDYPYLFSAKGLDVLYRNTVFALNQRGFFSAANGFGKLGYLYRDCVPEMAAEFEGWLHQIGLSSSQIVPFDVGCPATVLPSPSVLEQAVLTFQQHGVTHITENQGDFADFTKIAQQQGFHPKYGIPDDNVIDVSYGSGHPDYNNIANAIAITQWRFGEERTPGYVPDAGTVRCNALMAAHGQPPVYQQELGMGGLACDELWAFAAMVDHAPVLQKTALVVGLEAAQSVDFSYPFGPADFTGQRVTYGGQFWRPAQFFTSCNCWRVIDATFHPKFS